MASMAMLIVRSPSIAEGLSPSNTTLVDLKVAVGYLAVPKKSSPWMSTLTEPVSGAATAVRGMLWGSAGAQWPPGGSGLQRARRSCLFSSVDPLKIPKN